jgi:hypothetical protein
VVFDVVGQFEFDLAAGIVIVYYFFMKSVKALQPEF